MTVQEFYLDMGQSADEVIKRFGGSTTMLEKFLKKFADDPTFGQLEAAFAAGSLEDIFRAAHTLKGLSANFDFKELNRLAAKIVEEYRAGNNDALAPLFEELKPVYFGIKEKLAVLFA